MVHLDDFVETLFSEAQIQARVKELAAQIARDYHGRSLVVLTVMKGAANFSADLQREIMSYALREYGEVADLIPDIAIMSMYPSPNVQRDTPDEILGVSPSVPYEGNDVLVVEDIVDRGLTIKFLLERVQLRNPRSVNVCTLLNKPSKRRVEVPIGYVGFDVGDQFVVGYGLDYLERYRNVPFIGVLKPEIYEKKAG